MSDALVTYNATSKELRNIPETFAKKEDYVASILWEIKVGDPVSPGVKLGIIQWGNGVLDALNTPEGCTGKVQSLNRNIMYENLEYAPSQLFAMIG